jgi:cell division protein FtsB
LALSLALALIVPFAAPAAAQESGGDERVEALEREVEALRRALAELEARQEAAAAVEEAPAPDGEEAAVEETQPADTAELARRIDLLAAEIERLSLGGEVAPEAAAVGLYGLAPAASKVYRAERGLSIGGYGELLYQAFDSSRDDGAASGRTDELDFLRAIV